MGDNAICEHGVMKSICGSCRTLHKGEYVKFIDSSLDIVPLHRYGTVEELDADGFIWVREWDTNRSLRLARSEVKLKDADS